MNTAEAVALTVIYMREVKESCVRAAIDMDRAVLAFRGKDAVGMLVVDGDRDRLLQATNIAASGFGADIVTLTMDTWMTELAAHPDTGEEWEHGELAAYAAAHPEMYPEKFRSAVVTTAYNRAGDRKHYIKAYRTYHSPLMRGRVEVEWLDWEPSQTYELGGYIDENVRLILEQPTADVHLAQNGINIAETPMWRDHLDLATTRSVHREFSGAVQVMLFAEKDSERSKLFSTRLRPEQIIEPLRPPRRA